MALFQKRKWIEFSRDDVGMAVQALNKFHGELSEEKKPTDVIDDMLSLFDSPMKKDVCSIKLTHYELGAVINSLTAWWYKLTEEKQDTDALDNLTLRLCDAFEKW